jgi:hypothetical protein
MAPASKCLQTDSEDDMRDDLIQKKLLKPDLGSEILLTATGLVLFLPLLLMLVAILTHAN